MTGPFNPLGSIGTVASAVYIPSSEAFRLDSIVRVNTNAVVTSFEFQAIGSNTGWSQGAYIQRESTIYTTGSTTDFTTDSLANAYGPFYLHARYGGADAEQWRVRAQTASGWSDWTNFMVVTEDNSASHLPTDLALPAGRQISVGATPVEYQDWVGASDSDPYTFTLANAGTLRLDFSGLDDSIGLDLVNISTGNTPVAASSKSGAINNWRATQADVLSGASASFNLAAGDYKFTVAGSGPFTATGNTYYHLAVSFQ